MAVTSLDGSVLHCRDNNSISVNDVYFLAERERAKSAYQNRKSVMEHAQRQVCHDEDAPRPHSSASRFLRRCQSMCSSQPQCSRLSSALSTLKPNTPDHEDAELSPTIHCCEVMGPTTCQESRRVSSQNTSRKRAEASYPTLNIVRQNITMPVILKRFFPNLSDTEIHSKILHGEINNSYLPKVLQESYHTDEQASEDDLGDDLSRQDRLKQNERTLYTIVKLKHRLTKGAPTTPLYFHSIRDLNYKILTGHVTREFGFKKKSSIKQTPKPELKMNTDFPVFISPRKVAMYKEPSYKSYFAPPLLPRANQKPEPSFFAGSDFAYKLPDRLPDKVLFMDNRKKRLSSTMSTSSLVSDTDTPDMESVPPVSTVILT